MRNVAFLFFLLTPFFAFAGPPAAIKVGGIYAMTGEWAAWGTNCRRDTELALTEVNDTKSTSKMELFIEDSPNARPTSALAAFRKLTDIDGVKFIIGPMSPEEYAAVAPAADRSRVPLIPFVSSRIKIPAVMFMWMDPETEARRIADYVAARHRRIAILSSTQEWESLVAQAFKVRVEEKGLEVTALVEPPFDAPDIRAELVKLKQQKFDAIFVTSYLLFTKYLKELRVLGIDVPTYSIEIDASAVTSAGKASEGLTFIRPAAFNKDFERSFRAMWAAEADIPASQCYDAVMILNRAVLAGVSDEESFAKYFASFPPYSGASGTIAVVEGKTLMSTSMFEVKDGRIKRLDAR